MWLKGKFPGKKSLEKAKPTQKDNTKMDLKEESWEGAQWTDLFEDRDKYGLLCLRK